MAKKISTRYLRKLVEQVIEEERAAKRPRKRATRHQRRLAESLIKAKLLIEQEQEQQPDAEGEEAPAEVAADGAPTGDGGGAAVSGMDAGTDINSISPDALADALFSGEENDLYTAIRTATDKTDEDGNTKAGWAPGALAGNGAGDAAGIKNVAIQVFGDGDEQAARANFISRVGDVNTALGQSEGFEKAEMPALEGADVNALQDALNSQSGELGVDAADGYKDGEQDFEKWFSEHGDEAEGQEGEAASGEQEVQAAGHRRSGGVMLERWAKLAGLPALREISNDPRFPFPGPASVMDGAPNLGDSGAPDPSAIKGKAKAFLTKGKGTDGDSFPIQQNGSLSSSNMKPTQTNIKAGKSILFALIDAGADMEGAFATTDGEILDGHHRWSGQYLAHGGATSHTNVHLIDKGGMSTPEFLTMLTVVANALGRPTKLK